MSKLSLSNKIDYYTCWEDIQTIQKALNINKSDTVFTITSAGDNILNMLLYDPKSIISIDYNPYQTYLFELKKEAILTLNYQEFRDLMGLNPSNNKNELYNNIKNKLDEKARLFWDSNYHIIKQGVVYYNSNYIKAIGKLLRFLDGTPAIKKLFLCNTLKEQIEYFNKNIYRFHWRLFFLFFNNRKLLQIWGCTLIFFEFLSRKKKDPEDLNYIKQLFYSKDYLRKIEKVFSEIPLNDNYIASLLLLNCYLNEKLSPPYLQKKSYSILKKRIHRIHYKISDIYESMKILPDNSITKFYLSNVLDWVNDQKFKQILSEMYRIGKNGSRICYFCTRLNRGITNNINGMISKKSLPLDYLKKIEHFFMVILK